MARPPGLFIASREVANALLAVKGGCTSSLTADVSLLAPLSLPAASGLLAASLLMLLLDGDAFEFCIEPRSEGRTLPWRTGRRGAERMGSEDTRDASIAAG